MKENLKMTIIKTSNTLKFLKRTFYKIINKLNSVDITDEYINWLKFANAGMLHPGNLFCFDYVMRNMSSDAPMIEIGSFCGLSTNTIVYYKSKYGIPNRLITCDKWEFEGADKETTIANSNVTHHDYREFVKSTYKNNVLMFSRHDLPYTVEMISDDFFTAWRKGKEFQDVFGRSILLGGPISFCFIDGNHSYDYCRRDFENCHEFLERGGFILFDDSEDGSEFQVH